MKTIYTISEFNTKDKRLVLLVRETEQEAVKQIQEEIESLKRKNHISEVKIDYPPGERLSLGVNEHNAYVKMKDAEYFWHTDCIVETVFSTN